MLCLISFLVNINLATCDVFSASWRSFCFGIVAQRRAAPLASCPTVFLHAFRLALFFFVATGTYISVFSFAALFFIFCFTFWPAFLACLLVLLSCRGSRLADLLPLRSSAANSMVLSLVRFS